MIVQICHGAPCGECYRCRLAISEAARESLLRAHARLTAQHRELLAAVRCMRARQRAYFRTRAQDDLRGAKLAEDQVDQWLDQIDRPLLECVGSEATR